MRKRFGVYMLLSTGEPWLFDTHPSLREALITARTLRGVELLFPLYRVWIADAAAPPSVLRREA